MSGLQIITIGEVVSHSTRFNLQLGNSFSEAGPGAG